MNEKLNVRNLKDLNQLTKEFMEKNSYELQGMVVKSKESNEKFVLSLAEYEICTDNYKWQLFSMYDFNRWDFLKSTQEMLEELQDLFEFVGFLNVKSKRQENFDNLIEC